MLEFILIALTLASMLLIIYHHVGFPLIMRLARGKRTYSEPRLPARNYAESSFDPLLPSVTILIPAYNEERWIADKIRNLATLDYPREKLRVMIACDGCEDGTAALARSVASEAPCNHLSVEVREFASNRGKVAVVNELMQEIDTEFVALSDVSSLVSVDALQIAAWHFRDPHLGVLNGSYRLLEPGSEGEAAYWAYQRNIKMSEAALGATIGAHGAFYLFRRHLFEPLAPDTINDDFILPMNIVARGYRAERRLFGAGLQRLHPARTAGWAGTLAGFAGAGRPAGGRPLPSGRAQPRPHGGPPARRTTRLQRAAPHRRRREVPRLGERAGRRGARRLRGDEGDQRGAGAGDG